MRIAQKQEVLEFIASLHQAHEEIKEIIHQKKYGSAQNMLSECQEFVTAFGENIERIEGEGHITVTHIENYCETLFHVFEKISAGQVNENKIYKILRKQLLIVENSVKNDIPIKKEVVFFPYKASMWDSLESVYLAAREDPACDAYCVPIPYYDLNPDHTFGKLHYEGNEYPENIEIIDWQKYNFEERKPDVIYIHNPYDEYNLVTSVHPRFYSSNLKKFTDLLVYIPYYSTSGGMSEAQSLCPAYLHADYIVIQSPKFREYFDKNLPDQKFLPLGSPKFDRVINKCKNPPKPPAEWASKMTGKDGRRKKVIFYNTSINGMLADTENFLKKMEYVFKCFEGREDVCLLWRPHPLLESTFESLRPQYRQNYKALKIMFLEKDLGILDTMPDIADAIALSDAYIGDAGTSVTSLFGMAGKPIFILNNKIHNKPDADSWREEINVGAELNYLEQDRFIITQGNKLYVSEGKQYDYHYFCNLSDSVSKKEYSTICQIDGKKYACPLDAQNILKIGNAGVDKKIDLRQETVAGREFSAVWKYDRFLILLPLYYPAFVRFDTVTEECAYFEDYVDVFVKDKKGKKISGGSLIYHDALYIASPVDNVICRFDIENGDTQHIIIPIKSRCGCRYLVEYMDEMWMLPYEGKTIVRWNPQTGETREYEGFPEKLTCVNPVLGQECEELPFSSMAFFENFLYLAPQWANMYLRLNICTGQFTRWRPPFESGMEKNEVLWNKGFFLQPEAEEGGWHKLYSDARKRLYNVNVRTNESEEIAINFNRKELEDHERGFGECSETLRYACVENVFNSLDRFLDGATVGTPFDREKQFEVYREMAANSDGSCGKKIYEYIKAQG